MKKIAILGSANMDKVFTVGHMPVPGETIMAEGAMQNPGGKAANQAVASALQGGETYRIGAVGADADGDALLMSLQKAGVHTEGVAQLAGVPTGVANIIVSADGENMIVVNAGANGRMDGAQLEAAQDLYRGMDIGIAQLEIPLETVWKGVADMKAHGLMVLLNPSPACKIPAEVLRNVDILVPNETEMALMLAREPDIGGDDLPGFVRESGVGGIVMTLGPEGCCLATAEGVRRFPTTAVKAVDTTGAGDCFLGSMAAWLAQGDSLEEAIEKAMAAAAIAVTREGAQQAMPTRAEVLERIGK